ncbi:MAG: aspartate kinase [Legionellales bacterium]|nr:aspartate kinase [Legionellales bacterium]
MGLYVIKFGGTSVASIACMQLVTKIVKSTVNEGHQVVVVLSAMAGETDRLERLAHEACARPDPADLDLVLSAGEQISIGLLSILLKSQGVECEALTGPQAGICTDNAHNKARIERIETEKIIKILEKNSVLVVAGFQGVSKQGRITTLGRGGSDTSAVALAVALKAQECRIYTDVDGVYTTDPRLVPEARKMPRVTFEEMLELSSLGAKVLQIRAVEFAGKYNIPLRVLSTFKSGSGTLITYEDNAVEHAVVSGIAFNQQEAKIVVRGVTDVPGVAAKILGPISEANIDVDMIVQTVGRNGVTDFAFTVHRRDYDRAVTLATKTAHLLGAAGVDGERKIVKVSLVGVGMRSHAGIATKIFTTLANHDINIQLISTSEIKVSVVIDEKYLELAVKSLHQAFDLHKVPTKEDV